MLALLATTATWAATTLTMSDVTFTNGTGTITGTSSPYTIYAAKNNGSTDPAYNTNYGDLRVYAQGTLQLSTTGDNMTQIVFHISTQGKKRLAPITANTGTISAQASGDETVTWTGNASSVTFTVGNNADYGSDGSTKAGQLCFTSIVITEQGSTPTPDGDVFELVTDAGNLSSGDDIIIVAVDNTHAMGAVANSVGASATGFSLSGTQVTLNSNTDVVVYTLSGGTGAWALTNSNKSIGASNANLNTTGDAKWAITISNDVAKLVYNNESSRQLAYRLEGTTYNYFKHYATSNIDDQYYFNVKIYKRGSSSVDYPEVVGIAAFKQVESGTTVKLKLTDESNARVLHVESGSGGTTDAYVRDNSGALLLKGITPNRTMAYNQHLAGWIVGEYSVDATTGLPQLVPVADTNTAELVIADPVTEATTLPVEVEVSDMDGYLADWATVKNIRMGGGGAPAISDAFSASGYSAPYSNALVDINGIVANDAIYPMTEDASEYPLVTYVLDAAQDFTAPSTAVANVPVRWQRTFVADQWTPVTVPFAISDFDGVVMRYISLSDGGITTTSQGSYATGQMNFSQVSNIEAGVPYLVKTDESFSSMILDGVTITTTPAQTLSYTTNGAVTGGGNGAPMRALASGDTYSMVGTYSPTTVTEANTNKLVVGGDVVWANADNGTTVEGSSAYITTPKNQAIKLNMGGDEVITGIETVEAPVTPVRAGTYNLLGMKMPDDWEALPPGIYIVNGKKVVKQ